MLSSLVRGALTVLGDAKATEGPLDRGLSLGQDNLREWSVRAGSCDLEDQVPNKYRDQVPRCPKGTLKEPQLLAGLKGWVRHVKGKDASKDAKASLSESRQSKPTELMFTGWAVFRPRLN